MQKAQGVAFSPDGKYLATGVAKEVTVWDAYIITGPPDVATVHRNSDMVGRVALHPYIQRTPERRLIVLLLGRWLADSLRGG